MAARQAVPAGVVEAALAGEPKPARQRTLFPRQVLEFNEWAPAPTRREDSSPRAPRARPRSAASRRRERLEAAGQQVFDWQAPRPAPVETRRPPSPLPEEAPGPSRAHIVATPLHRCLAVALDLGLVGIGIGLFALVLDRAGGWSALGGAGTPLFVAGAAAIACLYKVLWLVGGADTPGMTWSGLCLRDFEGRAPTRSQRCLRLAGSCLSLAAAGLGFLWALGDAETLAWNDHLSKTFPSPRDRKED